MVTKMIFDNKKVIVFDLNGIIVDSLNMFVDIDYEFIYKMTGKVVSKDVLKGDRELFFNTYTDSKVDSLYYEYLKDKYSIIGDDKDIRFIREKITYIYILNKVHIIKNVDILLNKLRDLGYILILATVSKYEQIELYNKNELITNKIDLFEMFDLILTGDDIFSNNSNEELFLEVLEMIGSSKKSYLVFQNSLSGIRAAVKIGIDVCYVGDIANDMNYNEIDSKVTYRINSYDEVIRELDVKKKRLFL